MWGQKRIKFINGQKTIPFQEFRDKPLLILGAIISLAFVIYLAYVLISPLNTDKRDREQGEIIKQEQGRN